MILPFGRSPPLPTLDEAIIKERERRRGSFKTPNGRMKGKLLKDLMGKMAKNAGECDFWKLRARWCPSTVRKLSLRSLVLDHSSPHVCLQIETKVKSQSVCQSQLDEEADVTMQLVSSSLCRPFRHSY
jgi:ABC-type hemin transport system ATPase subunit